MTINANLLDLTFLSFPVSEMSHVDCDVDSFNKYSGATYRKKYVAVKSFFLFLAVFERNVRRNEK